MSEKLIRGVLHKSGPYPANWRLEYHSSKGGLKPTRGHWSVFSPGVMSAEDGRLDVVFIFRGGKADKVRLPDEDESVFDAAPEPAAAAAKANAAEPAPGQCRSGRYRKRDKARVPREFHNPYNFIPAPPPVTEGEQLGQFKPKGHHRYHPDLWNGRIRIEIETVTPLLIPDAAKVKTSDNDHKTFPVRVDKDGRPLLAPTSVKGMLRAAYEAVTNSRLGVFMGHDEPLAHRMDAGDGLAMIPARISDDGEKIELLVGTAKGLPRKNNDGRWSAPSPLYAAWLPRYRVGRGEIAPWAVKYPDGTLPQHGDHVWCWLELMEKSRNGRPIFTYWRVRSIAKNKAELPERPPQPSKPHGDHAPVAGEPMIQAQGWVCVTNQNFSRKHDERVFFSDGTAQTIPLSDDYKRDWRRLICDYKKIHEDDLRKRAKEGKKCDQFLGREPGRTAFSRHICVPGTEELKRGDLVYVRVNDKGEYVGLYPVMIGRELADVEPEELLPEELRPARAIGELSPADRVFGWVPQNGKGAWRGALRIGPVTCETEDAIEESFDEDGLPLAILGQPKPQQARFYVAKTKCGEAQADGISKREAAYASNKGLRGRKVYPHHAKASAVQDYWDAKRAKEDSKRHEPQPVTGANGRLYREYIRLRTDANDPNSNRDNQNRSVCGWVKPGTTFTTWLEVENLNAAELGALLWLLSLPNGHFHRLGGGKPLGFGSVRIKIKDLDKVKGLNLVSGAGRKKQFESLMPVKLGEGERVAEPDRFIDAFKRALHEAYGEPFEKIPFIEAFLKAARGYAEKPTHYPREKAEPDPKGENFKWFVENEKKWWRLALPNLVEEAGLPYVQSGEERGGRQGRHGHERSHGQGRRR